MCRQLETMTTGKKRKETQESKLKVQNTTDHDNILKYFYRVCSTINSIHRLWETFTEMTHARNLLTWQAFLILSEPGPITIFQCQ